MYRCACAHMRACSTCTYTHSHLHVLTISLHMLKTERHAGKWDCETSWIVFSSEEDVLIVHPANFNLDQPHTNVARLTLVNPHTDFHTIITHLKTQFLLPTHLQLYNTASYNTFTWTFSTLCSSVLLENLTFKGHESHAADNRQGHLWLLLSLSTRIQPTEAGVGLAHPNVHLTYPIKS